MSGMKMTKQQLDRIDDIALSHITADGPVNEYNVANYLVMQAEGVNRDNHHTVATASLNRLIKAGKIERYEDNSGTLPTFIITAK